MIGAAGAFLRLGVVVGLPKNIMNHVRHSPCIARAKDFAKMLHRHIMVMQV